MTPTIVYRGDDPILVIGAPGATRIVTAIAQVIVNHLDFGMSLPEAVLAPRFHAQGEAIAAQIRIPESVIEEVRRHHPIDAHGAARTAGSRSSTRSASIPSTGRLTGAADAGSDGMAIGGVSDRAAVTITAVREQAVSVGSPMRNALVGFSTMTCSVIGVTARRGDRTYTGFGYTSNGRYAQSGLLRDRFIPRLLAADPAALANETGDNLDPLPRAADPDAGREAGRPRRAISRCGRPRDGGLGPCRENRGPAGPRLHRRAVRRAGACRRGQRVRGGRLLPARRRVRASCVGSCGATWTSAIRS